MDYITGMDEWSPEKGEDKQPLIRDAEEEHDQEQREWFETALEAG